jgi:hypothetical protein
MSRSNPTLSPEVRALLDHERSIPPLPASVRVRALVRARAAVVAGGVMQLALPGAARRTRWVVLAAAICLVSAVVGAGAYEIRARLADKSRPAASIVSVVATPPAPSLPAAATAESTSASAAATAAPTSAPAGSMGTLPQSQADAARAELYLLRQARDAVARGNFAEALPLIAEHARRFKDGRLAEEREALRVKALSGLGRTEDARRAAAAFEARFPHSVLLPAVSQMPASGP